MKKFIIIGFVIFVCTGVIYAWFHHVTNKIFIQHKNSSFVNQTPETIDSFITEKKPFSILLLGYGGGNHDGAYLTDSMMLVRIDPKDKSVLLLSVPRDLWVKLPTDTKSGAYGKINSAYEIGLDDKTYPNKPKQFTGEVGGASLAKYIVGEVTGLPINYFVGLDFAGFTNTIDTLGGVDISVDTTFDDYAYPITGKENELCGVTPDGIASFSAQIATGSATEWDTFPCRFEHLHFTAGLQHMDGTTALKYVRSRHSLQDGTDFGRSKRQRNLLVAVKEKILSIGFIPKIIPFMTSLQDDLRTDISLDDVRSLITHNSELSKYTITNLALTDQNYLDNSFSPDRQAVLLPKEGQDSYGTIHNWVLSSINPNNTITNPIILVENGTKTSGLAQIASNNLKKKGLTLLDPQTANQTQSQTIIMVYNRSLAPSVIQVLKQEFGSVSIVKKTTRNAAYDVLIIIGDDYPTQKKSTSPKE